MRTYGSSAVGRGDVHSIQVVQRFVPGAMDVRTPGWEPFGRESERQADATAGREKFGVKSSTVGCICAEKSGENAVT